MRGRHTLAGAMVAAGLSLWWNARRRRRASWARAVVVITGGSRGLGFALATTFAAEGAIVWLASRDQEEIDRAVRRLRADGASAYGHVCDVTDPASVEQLVQAVVRRHARLDVVVNNAGVITAMPFDNAELDDFRTSLDTHFWGPLHVIRAAMPWLRRSHRAHIVNVSSIGGRVGVPHLAPYCAGKFALAGLSEVLRAELSPDIAVTLATPGLMRTGSVGRVQVRGRHVAEARWFAALSATALTSMDAMRAARQIVQAAACSRASVMPGWQARVQHATHQLAPELSAAVMAAVARHVLPAPVDGPSPARAVSEVPLGWAAPLVSTRTAVRYNQPEAALTTPRA